MKKLGVLAFGLMMSTAVFAQDEATTEPAAEGGYAEAAPDQGGDTIAPESGSAEAAGTAEAAESADTAADGDAAAGGESASDGAVAEEASPPDGSAADGSSGDGSSGSTDEYASEESGSEAEGEQGDSSKFYVAGDYVWSKVSFSKDALVADFGADELDSNMYRVRAGMRLFEAVGLEAQVGFDGGSSDDPLDGEYNTAQFYGVYLVPTGVLFDLIEVSGSIGYASTKLERGDVSETLSGASFGVNLDIPLFTSESLELRVGGGATVFRAQNSARIHGYHAGVRIDFSL